MKKEKICFLFILIMIIGSIMSMTPLKNDIIEDLNEDNKDIEKEIIEDDIEMTIYNYSKKFDITDDWYPINTHLCIEYSTYVYFVPFQDTLTIRKLNTSDGTSSLIVTETGVITKFYYDITNSKLYYYHNQATVSYVNLADDVITDLDGTLVAIEDIIVYSGDIFAVDTSEDDLTYYKYTAGTPGSWGAVGTIAEGATNWYNVGTLGGNDEPTAICWDGTYFYVLDLYDDIVYKYNAALDTKVAEYDIGTTGLNGGNDNPLGICWDGTYFYITDYNDRKVYKYPADFSVLTESYNLNIGTDRPQGICWDGTYFYVIGYIDVCIYKYPSNFSSILTTYDISGFGNDSPYDIEWDETFFYITDYNDKYVYKYPSDFSVVIAIFDIGVLGGNDNLVGICWDDNYFYITDILDGYVYKYHSDLTTELGSISYTAVISNKAYTIYQYITGDCKIYVKDLDVDTSPGAGDPVLKETLTSDLIIPYSENQRGISVSSNNDTLYFVMKDKDDSKTYLCTYVISTDTFTKKAEYNIALMLNRNSIGTIPPFNLEKAFHLTSLYIYQISQTGGNLYKIGDLTNAGINAGIIIAITDSYLIIKETDDNVELWKFESMNSNIISAPIHHAERDFPIMEINYNSNEYYLEKGMFVQAIGTRRIGTTTDTGVRFEGFVYDIEVDPLRGGYFKIVYLKNPAFFDLDYTFPSGTNSGRSDEHIEGEIDDNCNYITKGTFSAGQALGSISYVGSKRFRTFMNELSLGDKFSWDLSSIGELNYNNGTSDCALNYDQASPIRHVEDFKRAVLVNSVIIKGAIIDGTQIESAEAITPIDQQQYSAASIIMTIAFIDTVALANVWAEAILSLLGSEMDYWIIDLRDTTNGMIFPNQEITLENTKVPVITSQQVKINQVIYDDRTDEATYVVSSILRFDIEDLKTKLPEDNSELIFQINDYTTDLLHNTLGNTGDEQYYKSAPDSFNDEDVSTDETYDGSPDNFNDEAVGASGTDIAWVDAATIGANCSLDINAEVGNHKNILKFYDNDITTNIEVRHDLTLQADHIIEFGWRCDSVVAYDYLTMKFYEGGIGGTRILQILFNYNNGGDIDYNNAVALTTYSVDTWYHIKLILNDSANTFDFYKDGVLVGNDLAFENNSTIGVDMVRFETRITSSGYTHYLDAWGETSDANYTVGDNINPFGKDVLSDVAWLDSITLYPGSSLGILSDWQSHKKVLRLQDCSTATLDPSIYHSITQATAGIVEFWIGTNDITGDWQFKLQEGATVNLRFRINASKLYNYVAAAWVELCDVVNDTLYHVKIQWYADNTYDATINGIKHVDTVAMENNQVSGINRFLIIGEGDSSDYIYLDAWGNIADSDYNESDNYLFGKWFKVDSTIINNRISPGQLKFMWISASAAQAAGAKPATIGLNGNGFLVASFADGQEQQIQANLKIPDDLDINFPIQVCIGWSSPTISQDCDWEVIYLITNLEADTDQAGTTLQSYEASSATADGLRMADIGAVKATSTYGCIHLVIQRDGNDASDNLAAVAEVHGIALRYRSKTT